jgi:hypothetical protein
MINTIIYTFIFVCLLNYSDVYPQVNLSKTGQSTMNFLLVSTSSRASALGEAYTSLGTGSESMFFNPAGITGIQKEFDINISYTEWIADITYLSGGVAWNLGNLGIAGINLLTVDYGTINGTSLVPRGLEGTYRNGYVDNGLVNNVGAYAIGLTYAKSISKEFAIGGTVKLAGQNLGENNFIDGSSRENNASKLAFDAGIKYITGFKSFMFGMYIRNFASNIKRELVDEQLPLIFSIGFAMNLIEVFDEKIAKENMLNIALDFLHPNNYSERVNIGLEYKFLNMVSLRGGYQTNRDLASWSGGIGLNQTILDYDFEVSYSYSRFELFNNVSRLTLAVSF